MSKVRIEDRIGPCERLGTAYLSGYTLRFHKQSRKDGSGKCDALYTGNLEDRVWGALDRLTVEQFGKLDKVEGSEYQRTRLELTFGDLAVKAQLYVARPEAINSNLLPLGWYKNYVLDGAHELKLPSDYIDAIAAIPTMTDAAKTYVGR